VRSGSVEGRPLLVSFDRKALATLSLARVRQVVTIGLWKGAEAEESVECRDCLRCKESNGFAGRAGVCVAQTDRAIAEFKRGSATKGSSVVPCLHRFGASMPTVKRQAHPASVPGPQSSVGGLANSWPGRAATGSHTFRPQPQNTAQNPAALTPRGKHADRAPTKTPRSKNAWASSLRGGKGDSHFSHRLSGPLNGDSAAGCVSRSYQPQWLEPRPCP
jgi:hypothetical protein